MSRINFKDVVAFSHKGEDKVFFDLKTNTFFNHIFEKIDPPAWAVEQAKALLADDRKPKQKKKQKQKKEENLPPILVTKEGVDYYPDAKKIVQWRKGI